MKVLLYLGFSAALLCSMVYADHEGKKHDHKDEHDNKGDHQHHDHHHGPPDKHHHHADKSLSCHKLADSNSKFAYDLYRQIAADHPEENVVLSPVCISTALAFMSLGTMGNTHDQIIEGIGFNISEIPEKEMQEGFHHLMEMLNDDDRELHLHSGNGLFVSQSWKILDEFLQSALKLKLEAFSINFEENEEAKKQTNSYVEKKTNGKIVDMMSSVNKDAVFVLASFIYFRAKWEKPFESQLTKENDFHVNKNLTVKVPFMSRTGNYKTAILDEATVVSVPYKGNASALFILPKEGKMKEVESNLRDTVKKYKKSSHMEFVDLRIPKFSVSGSLDLKELLPKFGIVDLFSNSADLSGITGAPNLKISQARHNAKINVDEKGTEAAGATVMEGIPMRLPLVVELDHPFTFVVYDHNTKTTLFMGKVVNPAT
ncbi:PREDICTED: alpha-1-antitrypsin-like [Nanorana parkeri]|uniref:alpha-1-antitrypsin-like n=1 Tax=Nanorana parkeri TaxID=125878 RepID=UPI000853FEA6|nr:PREDICTED: alpha-1-antitrypsin-like [Nanorana parkeri]